MVEQVQILFQALGLTLLHFCWQGAIIALAAKLVILAMPRLHPRSRYAISLSAMLAMAAAAVATFAWEQARLGRGEEALGQEAAAIGAAVIPQGLDLMSLLPWLDAIWAAGVLMLTLRTLNGLRAIHRLKAGAQSVPEALAARFARAARILGLSNVHIRMHPGIDSPFVVGVLRSIVYLPVSAVMTLTPDQVDAVLAHELEHIRRADFAWNLLQTVLETLFFYHPAVWWLGRTLREQRELACDDAAVRTCDDPLTYATALLRLEEQRRTTPHLAVALNGDGSGPTLLSRVRRILGDTPKGAQTMSPRTTSRPALLAAPVVLITLAALAVPAAQVVAGTDNALSRICNIKSFESVTGGAGLTLSDTAEVAGPETPAAAATDGDVEPQDFWSDLMPDRNKDHDEGARDSTWSWVAGIDHDAIARAQIEGLTQGAEETRREAERLKTSDPVRSQQLQAASDRLAAQAQAARDNAAAQAQHAEAMQHHAEVMALNAEKLEYHAEMNASDIEAVQERAEREARKAERVARKMEAKFRKAEFNKAWDFPAPPEPPEAPSALDMPLPPPPPAPPALEALPAPPAPPAPPAKPLAVVASAVTVKTRVIALPNGRIAVHVENARPAPAAEATPLPLPSPKAGVVIDIERKVKIS